MLLLWRLEDVLEKTRLQLETDPPTGWTSFYSNSRLADTAPTTHDDRDDLTCRYAIAMGEILIAFMMKRMRGRGVGRQDFCLLKLQFLVKSACNTAALINKTKFNIHKIDIH